MLMRPLAVVLLCAAPVAFRAPAQPRTTVPPPVLHDSSTDSIEVTPVTIEAGRKTFHGSGGCVVCHGASLEGTAVAPTLRSHAWRDAKDGELDAIYYVVTHGVNGTAMVSHPGGISDRMAREVAAYIWAVNHRGEKP